MKNLKKLLASALLVCMLVSLLPVNALAEDEVCAHSETYVETVSPGCTTAGSNTTKCSACGATISSSVIPATGVHTAGEPVTVAASCTAEGSTTVSCTGCGGVLSTNVIQALGHSYSEAVTKAATCTEGGVKTFTCSGCGDSYTETIAVLGHSFSDATCTAPKTCKVCTATEGEPLGHDYAPATCTAPKTCKVCTVTEGEPLGHDYAPATCTTAKTCKVCTATEGEPLGHTAGETVTEPATCTVDGSITVKCSVCGEDASTEIISAPGHTAGESEVTTAPTCTEDGVKSVKCTACGDSYNEAIPALGHSYEEAVTTEATCTEKGVKTFSCTVDDCEDSYTEDIEALGHEYLNATCTAPKTCGRCEATEGEALGHKYENGMCSVCYALCAHSGGEASCTELAVCEICGLSYGELGHVGGVASCEALAVCEKCSQPYGDYGHKGGSADCEEKAVCELCGQPYGEPLGHKYNEQHECSVCGEKEPLLMMAPPKSGGLTITGKIEINIGATTKLDANDTVTWTSSDSAIAEVNADGEVTGKKGGNVTITATDGNNNEATHSIHVHEYAWDTTVSAQGSHQKKCSVEECPAPIIENAAHSFIYDDTNGYCCETCEYILGKPQIIRTDGTSPVAVGGYFELGYSNIPHVANVTWEYNADELSAEPSGFSTRFTAKEAGDLTISLKADGKSVASYTQNILANRIPATAVTISPESKTAYVGEMITFGTTLTPDNSTDKITWSTSDPTVVEPLNPSNPNGHFVASATGTATITAKANDDATATATITVVEKTLQITGGNTKLAKDATLNLSVTVTPDDTSNPTQIEWTSSHPDIATVAANGTVTGKAKGTATITATANDNSGASASVKVYVYE
ncbi:MAG: Ig-like domain-containing protein, partial [Oscillospiraceae bacterium]|nr:Ig-like domain-containing protein [Oscillospiraceae bacterium]